MILAVTGHRPDKLGGYRIPNRVHDAVVQAIDTWFMALRPETVITGMALGVDQWAAELCLRNEIPYIAAIPFPNFSAMWPAESRWHYDRLLSSAKEVHYVSQSPVYSVDLMHERDRWMVRQCNEVLAVHRPGVERSGTGSTARYAHNIGKTVHYVVLPQDIVEEAVRVEAEIEDRRNARQNQAAEIQRQNLERFRVQMEQRQALERRRQSELEARHAVVTATSTAAPAIDDEMVAAMLQTDPVAAVGRLLEERREVRTGRRQRRREPEKKEVEKTEEEKPVFRRFIEID